MRLYIVILSILFTYTRVKDKDMSDFITSTAHGPSTRLLMVRFDGAGTLRSGIFYFTTFCYNTIVLAKDGSLSEGIISHSCLCALLWGGLPTTRALQM